MQSAEDGSPGTEPGVVERVGPTYAETEIGVEPVKVTFGNFLDEMNGINPGEMESAKLANKLWNWGRPALNPAGLVNPTTGGPATGRPAPNWLVHVFMFLPWVLAVVFVAWVYRKTAK